MFRMTWKPFVTTVLLGVALLQPVHAAKYFVFTGNYTGRSGSKGIYAFEFDSATGEMGAPQLKAEIANPSWVTVHPNGKFLYAVGEDRTGSVTAFALDSKTGALTKLNTASSGGSGPCHIAIDKTGKLLLTANYGSGSVGVLTIGADGRLGEKTVTIQHKDTSGAAKPATPHAHAAVFSADQKFVFVPELGLDQIMSYKVDPSKTSITPNDPPFVKLATGAGPRHFEFHPKGKFAYDNNEISMTVTAFTYDAAKGSLNEIQTISTLPKDYKAPDLSTAESEIDPKGKFLYVSNRGHDTIAIFAIGGDGRLTEVDRVSTGGKIPRSFKIDPTGKYLLAANQNSNNVVAFKIDSKTGKLTPTGKTIEVGAPVCLVFVPIG